MDNGLSCVLRGFGLKCKAVARENSSCVCFTDMGSVILEKVHTSPERAVFLHTVKESLYSQGFGQTDRFIPSLTGKPYYIWKNDLYVLTGYIPRSELRYESGGDFAAALETISRMHSLITNPGALAAEVRPAREIYSESAAAMRGYKGRIIKKGQFSDFDVQFLNGFDACMHMLDKWRDLADNGLYDRFLGEACARKMLCHNLLKEENILFHNGQAYITNFSEAAPGHTLSDLAAFIRRCLKTAKPAPPLPFSDMLEIYAKHCRLEEDDIRFLLAEIIYPEKYLKLCHDYYAKSRSWTPGAFKARLADIFTAMDAQAACLKGYI